MLLSVKHRSSFVSCFVVHKVIIGLTVLSYIHEGLRKSDVRELLRRSRSALLRELGPTKHRPTNVLFSNWINAATVASPTTENRGLMPLQYLRPEDDDQVDAVHIVLKQFIPAAMHGLKTWVFPMLMKHQATKLTASGTDLGESLRLVAFRKEFISVHPDNAAGSSLLFGVRLGFSGTPSDLLPRELGRCQFEAGSQARIRQSLALSLIPLRHNVELVAVACLCVLIFEQYLCCLPRATWV
jgi:hypothetical protein